MNGIQNRLDGKNQGETDEVATNDLNNQLNLEKSLSEGLHLKSQEITVVGAGLAGSECALQLAHRGYRVLLIEMRDHVMTPAHKTRKFAELVCSNSFGSMDDMSAPGQLKWEAEQMGSYILKAAKISRVPAGQALGVDREEFSRLITQWVEENPLIRVEKRKVDSLSEISRPAVIATGPLTDPLLAKDMQTHIGEDFLYFYDAIAPILDADSIDMNIAWKANRYGKGTADYLNCPLNKEQYFNFIDEINRAKKVEPKSFEKVEYFEGCMPIETLVERGPLTPRFGPMKSIGLEDPKTGKSPFAAVQLRQDNKLGTAYNIVGFQTRMTYSEQVRVFRMIPGLENAEFLKLGSMHRNLFINTPRTLNKDLSSKKDPKLYFAGQITGVEGYFESTCIGIIVAEAIAAKLENRAPREWPRSSAFGSLIDAITQMERAKHFQPTNINFGLFPSLANPPKTKGEKKAQQIDLARTSFSLELN